MSTPVYVPPFIDPTAGLVIPSYPSILASYISNYLAIYPAVVYLGTDTAKYQELSILALKVYDTVLAIQLAINARSLLTAVGSDLDSILKMVATSRKASSYSTAPEQITGVPGTIITGGLVTDTSGNIWALPSPMTIPSGGSVIVSVTCTAPGAIQAPAGTITTPSGGTTAGWTGATNPSAASPGQPTEADSAARARGSLSQALPSLTRLQATLAAIAAVPGVTRYAQGIASPDNSTTSVENPTGATDYFGNPPHSISMVVEGGTLIDVATAIFQNRGLGCYTNPGSSSGSQEIPVTDPVTGVITTMGFQTPTYVPIFVTMTVHGLQGYTTEVLTAIQAALVTYLNSLQIGETLTYSSLYSVAQSVMPSLLIPQFSIRSLFTGTAASPSGTADITPAYYGVVQGISANVIVTAV